MLLFRLIADSSVFMLDVTRECKTAIQIGRPFEGMCDNFLLFIIREQTKALIWKAYLKIKNWSSARLLHNLTIILTENLGFLCIYTLKRDHNIKVCYL